MPYAPGGGTDVFSRLLAAQIEREFGQPLVIDNRGGGASPIGTQAVANAQPDGYTIGMIDSAFVTNPGLFKDKLPYDTRKDFVPVSLLSRTQLVLCVHPSSPFKTAQELVAFAKANPGKLTFASAGIGTGIHLAGEQFRQVDRDRDRDRALSRRRARARRLPVRQGGLHLRRRSDHPRAYPGRQGARAGRDARPRAAAARHSEHGGARLRQRRFRERDGPGRAGSDAGCDRREAAADFRECGEERRRSAQNLLERGFQPIGSTTEEFRAHVDREIEKWISIIAAGNIKPE